MVQGSDFRIRSDGSGGLAAAAPDVWDAVQPAPRSSGIRVSIDHFPKSCGPPEYHLRSIKRLKKKKKKHLGDVILDALIRVVHQLRVLRHVVVDLHSSLIGFASCIVKSLRSRRSFILSPCWMPQIYGRRHGFNKDSLSHVS